MAQSSKLESGKRNPVAKFAREVNKHSRHRNKKKDYKRNDKHKSRDKRDFFCLDKTQKSVL